MYWNEDSLVILSKKRNIERGGMGDETVRETESSRVWEKGKEKKTKTDIERVRQKETELERDIEEKRKRER